MMLKQAEDNDMDATALRKDTILHGAQNAYEAVVAIAKEARRLNAAPGIYLKSDEKPIPRAVRNFVDGRVDYGAERDEPAGSRCPGQGKK